MVGETEESLVANGIQFVVGRANYLQTPRGEIVGERIGFLKLLFHREDMRLLGVHAIGEHIGLRIMKSRADMIGAILDVRRKDPKGTIVTCEAETRP